MVQGDMSRLMGLEEVGERVEKVANASCGV
jgi:hypothetical protein